MSLVTNFTAANTKGDISVNFAGTPENLTGETVSGYVYIPADFVGAGESYQYAIYVQSAPEYGWDAGPYGTFSASGWQQVSFTIPAAGAGGKLSGGDYVTRIVQVGIQIYENGAQTAYPAANETIYFDDFTW
jgi:hypothetical protein